VFVVISVGLSLCRFNGNQTKKQTKPVYGSVGDGRVSAHIPASTFAEKGAPNLLLLVAVELLLLLLSLCSFHKAVPPGKFQFMDCIFSERSRDSSVGIATSYGLGDQREREFESR
jgi:hypothetical protein